MKTNLRQPIILTLAALLSFVCGIGLSAASSVDSESRDAIPSVPEIAKAGYKLAFSDEFNGSALDAEKQVCRTDGKRESTQMPANVQVAGGHSSS